MVWPENWPLQPLPSDWLSGQQAADRASGTLQSPTIRRLMATFNTVKQEEGFGSFFWGRGKVGRGTTGWDVMYERRGSREGES